MGKRKPKNKKKIIIFGAIGLLLVVVISLVAFSGNKERIVSVQTEMVESRDITQKVSATGKINPINQVIITPEVTGEIVELPVEEGDSISKGDLLIRIKPDIYIAQRNKSRANLSSAEATLKVREALFEQFKSDYERVKGLYEKGLASDAELEKAESAYLQRKGELESQKAFILQAKEALKEAEENLAKTAIYSPLNGTVSKLNVELGERVLGSGFSQGTNIMTVADLSQMEARVEVDENDVVLVELNDKAEIEIDAFNDKKFDGIVTQIGNSAITTGLGTQDEVVNFEVRIKILTDIEELRPGMSCDADISTETRENVLSVPIQCVTARQDKNKEESGNNGRGNDKPKEVVFVADNNFAKMKEVSTGISDDTYIEITEGLEGEEEVVNGPYRAISKELNDSTKIVVRKKMGNKKEK